MGDLVKFPRERAAELRIDELRIDGVDPGDAGTVAYPKLAPPHNLDAEAAVLEAVMLDRAALDRVFEILQPEHFYSEANQRIYQAAQQIVVAGTPVDMVTISRWLRDHDLLEKVGGIGYLKQFSNASPTVAEFTQDAAKAQDAWRDHVVAHAEVVLEKFEDRQLIATCQRYAAEGYTDVGNRAEWRAAVRAELGRITAPRMKLAGRSLGAVVQEARARVNEVLASRPVGVRYGFQELEDSFGMLNRQQQHILGGRTGMGKTALGFQICCNVASTLLDRFEVGEAVYVLSGEMPAAALVYRAACSMAGLIAQRVNLGFTDPDELKRLGDWMKWLEALPIVIDDQPAPAAEVARRVKAHKALFETGKARDHRGQLFPKCRMQLVMGDHIQSLAKRHSGCGPRADTKEKLAATSHGWLTDIAKGCDVATLLCSQLNRGIEDNARKDKWPRASDLEGAGEIEQDADAILVVHRPEKLNRKCSPRWIGVAGICNLKGRFGEGRRARLGFDRGYFTDALPAASLGEPYSDTDDE